MVPALIDVAGVGGPARRDRPSMARPSAHGRRSRAGARRPPAVVGGARVLRPACLIGGRFSRSPRARRIVEARRWARRLCPRPAGAAPGPGAGAVSYTHLRAHETVL